MEEASFYLGERAIWYVAFSALTRSLEYILLIWSFGESTSSTPGIIPSIRLIARHHDHSLIIQKKKTEKKNQQQALKLFYSSDFNRIGKIKKPL